MLMLIAASFTSSTWLRMLSLQRRDHTTRISKVLLDAWFMDHMEFLQSRCHQFLLMRVTQIILKNKDVLKIFQNKRNISLSNTVKFQFQCSTRWLLEVWINQFWLKRSMRFLRLKILTNSKRMFSNVQEPLLRLIPNRICMRMITFHTILLVTKTEKDKNWILKCS